MKKKWLALLLSAVLLVSAGFPVGYAMQSDGATIEAEISQSLSDTSSSAESESDVSSPSIGEMTVEEQYAYLLSLGDELAQEAFAKLDAQQQEALLAYAGQQQAENSPEGEQEDAESSSAVNFDKVAPLENALRFAAPLMKMQSAVALSSGQSNTDDDGLELSKTAEALENGQYRLTLEAYTTGTVTSGEVKPCDIILVLDQSTSMTEPFSGSSYRYNAVYNLDHNTTYYVENGGEYIDVEWCNNCQAWTNGCVWFIVHIKAGTKYVPKASAEDGAAGRVQFYTRERVERMTRLEALQQAASSFVDQIAEQDGDHRIALVGFENDANYLTGRGNEAFWDASTRANGLKQEINNLGDYLDSATEHGEGLAAAASLLRANTSTDRRRIVVLFTDGEPAPDGTDHWSSRIVKQAVEQSHALKNTYDAAVYTVSVMPGADAANPVSDMDKYMDAISSNYPNARYTGRDLDDSSSWGPGYYDGPPRDIIEQIATGNKIDTTDGSFYLTAGDIETLNSIFEQIADQTGGADISLGASAVIRDVISDYFTLPEGADASSITVTTQDAVYDSEGHLSWTTSTMTGTPVATVSGNEVQVTGFDFDRNFVAETGRVEGDVTKPGDFHGRKVVISFLVEPKEGFWGGNDVPTNGEASGVYTQGSSDAVDHFKIPTVNVPLNLPALTGQDQDIYLLTDTSGLTADKFTNWTVPSGDDAWKVAFVNITGPAFTNPNQQISNTADSQVEVSVTVSAQTDGSHSVGEPAQAETLKDTASVNVYKPTLTYKDSVANTGDVNYSYEASNYVSVVWKHGESLADTEKMGPAPTLAKTYTPRPDGAISFTGTITATEDVPVTVTVKIGNADVTQYVTFNHEPCTVDGCQFHHETEQFIVHIDTLSLTITKTVEGNIDPDQTYLFHVQGVEGTATEGISLTVTIKGSGSVTIQGLPSGSYTVTEDTSWSWRYEPEGGATKNVTVSRGGVNQVDFVNKKTDNQWLTDEAYAENLFTGKKKGA